MAAEPEIMLSAELQGNDSQSPCPDLQQDFKLGLQAVAQIVNELHTGAPVYLYFSIFMICKISLFTETDSDSQNKPKHIH